MTQIEIIPHNKKTWPSGITSFTDPVQSHAERIGRQEVSIAGAIDAQLDMPIYAFLPGQSDLDLDPWRYTEGLDPHTNGAGFDLWFDSGACKTFDLDDCPIRFFVDKSKLEACADRRAGHAG